MLVNINFPVYDSKAATVYLTEFVNNIFDAFVVSEFPGKAPLAYFRRSRYQCISECVLDTYRQFIKGAIAEEAALVHRVEGYVIESSLRAFTGGPVQLYGFTLR